MPLRATLRGLPFPCLVGRVEFVLAPSSRMGRDVFDDAVVIGRVANDMFVMVAPPCRRSRTFPGQVHPPCDVRGDDPTDGGTSGMVWRPLPD